MRRGGSDPFFDLALRIADEDRLQRKLWRVFWMALALAVLGSALLLGAVVVVVVS